MKPTTLKAIMSFGTVVLGALTQTPGLPAWVQTIAYMAATGLAFWAHAPRPGDAPVKS